MPRIKRPRIILMTLYRAWSIQRNIENCRHSTLLHWQWPLVSADWGQGVVVRSSVQQLSTECPRTAGLLVPVAAFLGLDAFPANFPADLVKHSVFLQEIPFLLKFTRIDFCSIKYECRYQCLSPSIYFIIYMYTYMHLYYCKIHCICDIYVMHRYDYYKLRETSPCFPD